jgi:structural maintenance of chromosome 3 (chondroitin sulfate proteoglycan 6)
MYIKQIIIQGFKSYKDQTSIEPFSPRNNVIVGRNGSGKSNFFAAVRFVLGDENWGTISAQDRSALLHEGSGSAVVTAYVEVIFDNSDERFPTGKPELILRRTIGMKKDEYSIDRKSASRTDVVNLLESAGFSRSNPYYIVPQGRVTTLTNMKDNERLNLLKDVAGTKVYEGRRAESIKIMDDTDHKRSRIDDLLGYINERLAQLEEEKAELLKYQELSKEVRCLEFSLFEREKQTISHKLEQIEVRRDIGVADTDEDRETFIERQAQIDKIDDRVKQLLQDRDILQSERRQLDDDRKDKVREKAKIELEVRNLTQGQASAQKTKAQYDSQLQSVQQEIRTKQQELDELLPIYSKQVAEEKDVAAQLESAQASQARLRAKQNRSQAFKSKQDRDRFLQGQIDEIKHNFAKRKAIAMQIAEDIGNSQKNIGKVEAEIADLQNRLNNRGNDVQSMSTDLNEAKEELRKLQDQRKELFREQDKIKKLLETARQSLNSAEFKLMKMTDRNTWDAIKYLRYLRDEEGMEGLYGTLGELFEVSDRYRTAVEVTAGQSLFHYVVDNENTATKVIQRLLKDKRGRVTCMPLNRLRPSQVNVPNASDAVHMVSKLNFDPKFEPAMQHVFGKTIICPNLQVASQYARSHSLSAITPDGDRADKKGALTGGYYDIRSSRIEAASDENKAREAVTTHEARSKEINKTLEIMNQQITKADSECRKIDNRMKLADDGYDPMRQELRSRGNELQRERDALERLIQRRESLESEERKAGEDQEAYEAELRSAFQKALSSSEEQELQSLNTAIQDLRKQLTALSTKRSETETRKVNLESELRENLRPRLEELNAQAFDTTGGTSVGANSDTLLKTQQHELKRVTKSVEAVEKQIADADADLEKYEAQLAQFQKQKSDMETQQKQLAKTIEQRQLEITKNMNKKGSLTRQLQEVNKRIRDLGVLPDDAFDRYKRIETEKIAKRLPKVREELKKFAHVNKKAFEQYNNFTRQREGLKDRRKDLDASHESIQKLIDHLDLKKDEAIERTFKQVSKEFAYVFERLVPAGKGRLVIMRKSDRDRQLRDPEDSEEEELSRMVENYIGVGISVSFNSKHDDQQKIQQLSGGQKSESFRCLSILMTWLMNMPRSMCTCPRIRDSALRSRPVLPLRRD